MKNRFFCDKITQQTAYLNPEESQHCIKVLRLSKGSIVTLLDGKGNVHEAIIEESNPKKCKLGIIKTEHFEPRELNLTVCISPPKSIDRLEWFVEKSVEIGIEEICFVQTERSERKHINNERIRKKAISALKQSGTRYLPLIHNMIPLKDVLALHSNHSAERFIAHLIPGKSKSLEKLITYESSQFVVLIGPEGDFTENELDLCLKNGFKSLKLGNFVLRTETAGVHICSFFAIKNLLTNLQ